MNWCKIRYVIIIIEIAQREYQAKKALQNTINTTGRHTMVPPREYAVAYLKKNREIGEEILIIEKSAQHYLRNWFSFIKNMGASLIVLEEEGWVPFNWEDYMARRLPKSNVKFIDEYWCSNRVLFENVKFQYPNLKTILTGHPRWDVLNRNAFKCVTPKDNDRDTILLVSTFGMLSSDIDFMKVIQSETGENFDMEFYDKILAQLKIKFEEWCTFLGHFEKFQHPTLKTRLRLHPAELGVYDESLLNKYQISTNSLGQDLRESFIVIHPGSTVAFDAEACGVPNIMLDDDTNILLSADPENRRVKSEYISDILLSEEMINRRQSHTGTILCFSYRFTKRVETGKIAFRKPAVFFII